MTYFIYDTASASDTTLDIMSTLTCHQHNSDMLLIWVIEWDLPVPVYARRVKYGISLTWITEPNIYHLICICEIESSLPCHVMSCHVMSCHVMSCHVMSCHVMSCHAMPCHAMPCHAMPCHHVSCAVNCHCVTNLITWTVNRGAMSPCCSRRYPVWKKHRVIRVWVRIVGMGVGKLYFPKTFHLNRNLRSFGLLLYDRWSLELNVPPHVVFTVQWIKDGE